MPTRYPYGFPSKHDLIFGLVAGTTRQNSRIHTWILAACVSVKYISKGNLRVMAMNIYFICRKRKWALGSYKVVLVSYGLSSSIPVGERSVGGRSLITAPCPPIALADPGSTSAV